MWASDESFLHEVPLKECFTASVGVTSAEKLLELYHGQWGCNVDHIFEELRYWGTCEIPVFELNYEWNLRGQEYAQILRREAWDRISQVRMSCGNEVRSSNSHDSKHIF